MLFLKSLLLSTALLSLSDAAAIFGKRDEPKVLAFDVAIRKEVPGQGDNTGGLSKRTENVTLTNQQYWYSISVALGSNKQQITLDIDTGSSDTWVVDSSATCDYGSTQDCKQNGVFDPLQSTTFRNLSIPIHLRYGIGNDRGTYALEDLWLPSGDKVSQLRIVDVYETHDSNQGLLGLGLNTLEASASLYGIEYENLPYALKSQGLTKKAAYSLYLNSIDAKGGKLIFGGYDTEKISGNFPEIALSSTTRLSIPLKSVSFNGTDIAIGGSANLDSGTTYTYLPTDVFNAIVPNIATYSEQYETYIFSCDQPHDKFISYKFDGVEINVPYSSLVQVVQDPNTFDIVDGVCQPGIGDSGEGTDSLLGDTFLRSAYAIFNLEDKYIKLGQVKYTDSENIVEI